MLPLLIGPALGALSIYAGYQMAAQSREDAAKRRQEEADAKQRQKSQLPGTELINRSFDLECVRFIP